MCKYNVKCTAVIINETQTGRHSFFI